MLQQRDAEETTRTVLGVERDRKGKGKLIEQPDFGGQISREVSPQVAFLLQADGLPRLFLVYLKSIDMKRRRSDKHPQRQLFYICRG